MLIALGELLNQNVSGFQSYIRESDNMGEGGCDSREITNEVISKLTNLMYTTGSKIIEMADGPEIQFGFAPRTVDLGSLLIPLPCESQGYESTSASISWQTPMGGSYSDHDVINAIAVHPIEHQDHRPRRGSETASFDEDQAASSDNEPRQEPTGDLPEPLRAVYQGMCIATCEKDLCSLMPNNNDVKRKTLNNGFAKDYAEARLTKRAPPYVLDII